MQPSAYKARANIPVIVTRRTANSISMTFSYFAFLWPAALPVLSHGRDLAEVFRPALGCLFAADATRISGNF
jgi:hypothetical protein